MASELIAEAITDYFGERCLYYAEGCPTCEAWAEYDRMNTRPAPAATDTGLETVGVTGVMPGSSGGFTQVVFRADDVPANIAVCLHSQAEGLLAAKEAERAEQWRLRREMEADRDTQKAMATSLETELAAERAKTERWHKKAMDAGVIVHSDGTTSHPMRKERDDLKADNAAKDARIKELEEYFVKCISNETFLEQDARRVRQIEALEAKLAAAEKALETIDWRMIFLAVDSRTRDSGESNTMAARWMAEEASKAVRAVLGGEPS